MVSQSRDGEMISRTIKQFGFEAVRGSSSSGGSSALLALIKKLSEGADVAISPDGPRGPRYNLQMGVIHLAQKSGHPIVPVATSASKSLRLKSWDGFMIPLPFSRGALIYGDPLEVSSNSDPEKKKNELEKRLREITGIVDSFCKGGEYRHYSQDLTSVTGGR